ncbi:hypothetical protein OPV22_020096 [Ensete ventricosum]|uniref:Bifunctional inhibitor/plant lipid transfer protein/seed storage helical domain-containing protein n=1 Tax=Ensete ventricosum TaxID=4639 RepID=A0AAV8QIJ7_ENSVE|nr:hypothetical protein OPV22_020096 [Ensete ventricosum]RWW90550.1 hypothetical protein BHE74_00000383 [Ensete ventricosum]
MAKYLPTAPALAVAAVLILLSAVDYGVAEDSLCKMTEKGMVACLPSVTGGASPAPPSDRCCSALSRADLPCLCRYKDSPVLSQVGVKPELAKQLLARCKLGLPGECN